MAVRQLTMGDLELFYQGMVGHPFLELGDMIEITKAAGEVATGLGEPILNQTYGAFVWAQLNQEANAFGILPKTTWVRSGWRVKTAFATTASSLGVAETDNIPAGVRPEIEVVRANPKINALSFEVTDVVEALANTSADDIWGSVNQVRAEMGVEFVKYINQQLLTKYIAGYDASKTFVSLDHIVSSHEEAGLTTDPAPGTTIYSLDRSTDTWADAVVLHNDGTARDLTDELIRQLLKETRENGGNTTVILTGYDTYAKIQGMYMNFIRYMPMSETQIQVGVNGIQTAEGTDVGLRVSALYGIPLIQAVDTPKDTISRIYALDTSDLEGYGLPRLAMSILRPVEYFESRDYVLLNKFAIKGVYRIVGEAICRFFAAQGKIRDLQ